MSTRARKKQIPISILRIVWTILVVVVIELGQTQAAPPAKEEVPRPHTLRPVPLRQVTVDDAFWSPRYETWRKVTIPDVLAKFEKDGAVANYDHVRNGDGPDSHKGFPSVTTAGLRIEAQLQSGFSGGILEWKVE